MNLTKTDKKILALLQKNGRMPNAELAQEVGLSNTACWNHTKQLMEKGFIKEVTAVLDPVKIDLPVLVCVGVVLDRSTPESFSEFERSVKKIPTVLECLLLAGEFDYWLKIRVKDIQSFNRLHANVLLQLPGVRQLRTFFVLSEIKDSLELPLS